MTSQITQAFEQLLREDDEKIARIVKLSGAKADLGPPVTIDRQCYRTPIAIAAELGSDAAVMRATQALNAIAVS